jgi:dolichyl-phosphate beta-glucosyltransferase
MMTGESEVFLSVVIPACDEEARIGKTLRAVRAYLESRPYASEIIVVGDGCRDRTCQVASEYLRGRDGDRVLDRAENRGKGFSVAEGVAASRGRFILFSDADLSTPIEELEKLLPEAERGADVVIGSRALPESDVQVRQNRLREGMGKIFNVFVRLFVLRGIKDTQCGFKLFKREAALDIFPRLALRGFSFDVEALYLARRRGFRIVQVPVIWRNSPTSRVRLVRSSAAMLRDLLRIRGLHRRDDAEDKPPERGQKT